VIDRIVGSRVRLEMSVAGAAGRVRADREQLEQVLNQLCVNAREAMPDGGTLRIEARAVVLDEANASELLGARPGPHVLIAVTDTGRGMDRETVSRIFEPFFSTKAKVAGRGLGLPMVYGIIRQTGGQVRVYSEPGVGTTFKIYLPAVIDPADEVAPVHRRGEVRGGSETILLVDDEDSVRKLASVVLRARGYTVVEARDGLEALESMKERPVDLVVSDVMMPGLKGTELAQRLKAERPGLPVMLMSGYAEEAIREEIGGVQFLGKPFASAELLEIVRRMLDEAQRVSRGREAAASRSGTGRWPRGSG
jgi:two-component system, cell cycle sensor histidine kinase and response regulator CckA